VEIAALILSIMSLVISCFLTIIMVAKHYFSSHVIQYKPVEDMFSPPPSGPTGKPMGDEFREFDQLTPEEIEYFEKQKKKI
jgi:hypothetical protein